jgi:CheY-like chemotaxis protein
MFYRVRMKAAPKILAVDDNPAIIDAMPFIFPAPKYKLVTASDGSNALEQLDTGFSDLDVIIVDQKMPRITGVELVRGVRERGITAEIIVLSAHLSPGICKAYEDMGVHVIIGKPFNISELRLAVNHLAA